MEHQIQPTTPAQRASLPEFRPSLLSHGAPNPANHPRSKSISTRISTKSSFSWSTKSSQLPPLKEHLYQNFDQVFLAMEHQIQPTTPAQRASLPEFRPSLLGHGAPNPA